jgi:uncharacterized protein (DUF1778 family)
MSESKETATANLNLRVKPSDKALIVQRAAAEGRSVANYLVWLAQQDAAQQDEQA